jgi:hypothetical protein
MYLRTTRRRNADGSTVSYYQLAENTWDSSRGCAVAKVIYSFGRADQLDRQALQRLVRSILRILSTEEAIAAEPDVRLIDAWPYGGLYVFDALWRELEVDAVVAEHKRKHRTREPFERALFAMAANRALAPYSKRRCRRQWLGAEVFFPLDVDLIFYDTTSLHCEIDQEDEAGSLGNVLAGRKHYPAMRRYGKAKNGRDDVPQLVVGLAVTRDGLPVRSWVFPGQTADVTTIERVKADLQGWKLNRCVFVGDAGMNSEEIRRTLTLGGGKYILATKLRAGDEVTQEVLTRAGRYQTVAENLRVKEVTVGDGERRRRYVVCHNPQEAERQRRHREKLLELLKAELAVMRQPVVAGRHAKHTCELLTSQRFSRYLRQTRRGLPKISRAKIAAERKLDGKWVITSNDDTLSAEDLALGYKQLMRVEE